MTPALTKQQHADHQHPDRERQRQPHADVAGEQKPNGDKVSHRRPASVGISPVFSQMVASEIMNTAAIRSA